MFKHGRTEIFRAFSRESKPSMLDPLDSVSPISFLGVGAKNSLFLPLYSKPTAYASSAKPSHLITSERARPWPAEASTVTS